SHCLSFPTPRSSDLANVTFASPPALVGGGGAAGSTNISIIPWACGIGVSSGTLTTNETTFVTYDTNGKRAAGNANTTCPGDDARSEEHTSELQSLAY